MGDDVATRFDDIGPLLKNRGITPMLVKWEVELLSSCSHGERRVLEWTMRVLIVSPVCHMEDSRWGTLLIGQRVAVPGAFQAFAPPVLVVPQA
jgi:hypothetical protein